jgi:hypothetical protein
MMMGSASSSEPSAAQEGLQNLEVLGTAVAVLHQSLGATVQEFAYIHQVVRHASCWFRTWNCPSRSHGGASAHCIHASVPYILSWLQQLMCL